MNQKLIAIGYWFSQENENYPNPVNFIDIHWDKNDKERVLSYLKKGEPILSDWIGDEYDWCRFKCTNHILSNKKITDGFFIWPESLSHYIENHNIRLPEKFVDHVNSINNPYLNNHNSSEIDFEWWLQQKGFNKKTSSISLKHNLYHYGIIEISNFNNYDKKEVKVLFEDFFKKNPQITKRYYVLESFHLNEKILIENRFIDLELFISQANKIGINISFQQYSENEYMEKGRRRTKMD